MRPMLPFVLVCLVTASAGAAASLLPPPEMRADLSPTSVSAYYGAAPGATFPLYVTVRNHGDAPAYDVPVQVFLDDVLFEATTLGSIAAGRTDWVATTATWTSTVGRHELRAVVDPANAILEWDEDDNEITTAFDVRAQPELRVTDITWTPEQPDLGDTMTFTATVENVGTVDAGAGRVWFYVSSSGTSGTVGLGSTPPIPAGGSIAVVSPPWTAGSASATTATSPPFSETVKAEVMAEGTYWMGGRSESYALARPGLAALSGGDASGIVAVSLNGRAKGTVAVSGTGDASGAIAGASGTGHARGYTAAASGTGDATSYSYASVRPAVSPTGEAAGNDPVSALGTCNGQACVAASPEGDADGWYGGVTGTGHARGGWFGVSGTGDAECWSWTPFPQECLAASGTRDADGRLPVAPVGDASTGFGGIPVSLTGTCEGRSCVDVEPYGPASGHYLAASGDGDASSEWIAVAPTGDARGWALAATATGQAGEHGRPATIALSGTGPSHGGNLAVSGTGRSSSFGVPVSGTGNADGELGLGANYCDGVACFAVEPDGDARGHWLAAASGGRATGDVAAIGVAGDAECTMFNCVAVSIGGCAEGSIETETCGLV
ncbi:MAG TPA: CARDB domain-containing protein [Candidatus Thermoplasmatota archaeon]|nr:CARDB domain-containing protein [Candidatus Thermoplasmatota archaeon]